MSFTRIDCHFYRGHESTGATSSFAALNPHRKPGSLVAAGSSAARESLGGQVACKLALEHFVEGVLDYFDGRGGEFSGAPGGDISLEVLEAAFRRSNLSVYNFGHKLAAGGRMAASLIGVVIEQSVVAAGRVGHGSAYLCRSGQLFPFFESDTDMTGDRTNESFIGSNSLVAVELASVPVQESDVIVLFSTFLDQERERDLAGFVEGCDMKEGNPCHDMVNYLFPDLLDLSFCMMAKVGPDTIYLAEPLEGGRKDDSVGAMKAAQRSMF